MEEEALGLQLSEQLYPTHGLHLATAYSTGLFVQQRVCSLVRVISERFGVVVQTLDTMCLRFIFVTRSCKHVLLSHEVQRLEGTREAERPRFTPVVEVDEFTEVVVI